MSRSGCVPTLAFSSTVTLCGPSRVGPAPIWHSIDRHAMSELQLWRFGHAIFQSERHGLGCSPDTSVPGQEEADVWQ